MLAPLVFASISYLTWLILKDTALKFSPLLWAFLFSIIAANAFPAVSTGKFKDGIDFTSSRVLRWSIALLGLTISASVWVKLGPAGLLTTLLNLLIVFTLGILICKYVVKMDDALSILIAAGTAICGASAIAAVGPAIKAKGEAMGLALAAVTLFGLAAMVTYPLLYNGPVGQWLGNSPAAFGMWTGTGIHDTAQVIAAASQVDQALSFATSAKFIRIFMIGPIILISLFLYRRFSRKEESSVVKFAVPWFAVFFVLFTIVHLAMESSAIKVSWLSFNEIYLKPSIMFLLTWAFAAIGLKVKISTIRVMGAKAFAGGVAVAVLAGVISLLLVKFVWIPLS